MISRKQYEEIKKEVLGYFDKNHIVLSSKEKENIEVADFGLGRIRELGLQLIEYINTERVCAKDLVLLPHQVCPEHLHPSLNGEAGKEETFRCRYGTVFLYVEGPNTPNRIIQVPSDKKHTFTVFHEVVLHPGEQYTIYPDTLHWFKAGQAGAIVSEFSTKSTDEKDLFTDTEIKRLPVIDE